MSASDKYNKVINAVMGQVQKQFGADSIMRLGEESNQKHIKAISTGSIAIDLATGIGGLPRGRVIEIFGPEASGKTTLCLHVVAQAQALGGLAAFVDAEHALDVKYAKNLGVNTDDLMISQPDCGEQALEVAETLVRTRNVDVLVVDSVAALTPRAEIDGEMGDAHMGLQARLMSQALRKLTSIVASTGTCMIFVNQTRQKIGGFGFGGANETTSGGNALKFYSSMRIDIRRIGALKDGEKNVGNRTRVKMVKNKVAPPFQQVEFDILFGVGISAESELVDLGLEFEVVEKAGTWYSFNGERLGQGKENARAFLKDNPNVAALLKAQIMEKIGVDFTDNLEGAIVPVDERDGEVAASEKKGKKK